MTYFTKYAKEVKHFPTSTPPIILLTPFQGEQNKTKKCIWSLYSNCSMHHFPGFLPASGHAHPPLVPTPWHYLKLDMALIWFTDCFWNKMQYKPPLQLPDAKRQYNWRTILWSSQKLQRLSNQQEAASGVTKNWTEPKRLFLCCFQQHNTYSSMIADWKYFICIYRLILLWAWKKEGILTHWQLSMDLPLLVTPAYVD